MGKARDGRSVWRTREHRYIDTPYIEQKEKKKKTGKGKKEKADLTLAESGWCGLSVGMHIS